MEEPPRHNAGLRQWSHRGTQTGHLQKAHSVAELNVPFEDRRVDDKIKKKSERMCHRTVS